MVDIYRLNNRQMAKLLRIAMQQTRGKGGVIMFDLHPIRVGQLKYVDLLEHLLTDGLELNGWFPKVTEAVEHWNKYGEWKDGASFCGLLTGDIDNFTFSEYLTRLF
jgi:hypothetical protein